MNIELFYKFFELSKDPFIAKVALFLSYPFAYGLVVLLAIWAIFISHRKMYNFSLLLFAGLSSWAIASTMKNILKISRPFVAEQIVPLYRSTGFAFPSIHMAIFTSIAVAMFLINKKLGIIFSLIAILIGISRMIIGVHYPVDILGGLGVGLIVGLIFTEIYKKI